MADVVFTRGELPESRHAVLWCATGPGGEIEAESATGAAGAGVFARSAVKPLQALPGVRAGVLERFGLGDRHLALACASHGGADAHLAVAEEMLAAAGMGEGDLACGPLDPRDPAAAAARRAAGAPLGRVVNNCSGKHAFALALCRLEGWPAGGYTDAGHPLQDAMRAAVADAVGLPAADVPHGVDGCGMLAFRVPLAGLARAFGRLASGGLGDAGDRVAAAMRRHPELVAFPGALDTELMRAAGGLVAKIGAEGVLGVGLADGRGLAMKVVDGALRALDPAGVALAGEVLGVDVSAEGLRPLAHPRVLDSRGRAVGGAVVTV